MTDAKRLLAEANERPWHRNTGGWFGTANGQLGMTYRSEDAALIVYAVNHLPDYLAAVEALEALIATSATYHHPDAGLVLHQARAALARLRDEVPV